MKTLTSLAVLSLAVASADAATAVFTKADFEAALGSTRNLTLPNAPSGTSPSSILLTTTPTSFDGVTVTFDATEGASNYALGPFSSNIAGNSLAISGRESWIVDFDTATNAFGFVMSEPTTNSGLAEDSCNATCVQSTFRMEAFLGTSSVGFIDFMPDDDVAFFVGIVATSFFDSVKVTEIEGGIDNEFFGEFIVGEEIPLPAGAPMFLTAFGAVAAWRKSRQT